MRARLRDVVFLLVVLGGAGSLAAGLLRPLRRESVPPSRLSVGVSDRGPIVARVDATFRQEWTDQGMVPASPAAELAIMRRLSLSLAGTIPSLEEIRRFEARPTGGRVDSWLDDLLHDRRCADYLAERFARAFVGTEDGPFLKFRRRRFVSWLSDAILEDRRYDAIVRDLIADDGVWTDHPAVNFLAVTIDEKTERPTPDRLAARVSRAFLGVRHRLRPVPQSPVPALEAIGFPRHRRLLRRDPRRLPRHPRPRERVPSARSQGQGMRPGRAMRALPLRVAPDFGRTLARGSPAGSPTRGTRTSPGRR